MKNDYDAPDGEAFDEIYQSDGLRWMSIMVVCLVVFGFFSLAWYAYRTNTAPLGEEGEVYVIEGDDSPYKEKPENPGGMVFAHQDKDVYNRLVAQDEQEAGKPVERLLPPPESPFAERHAQLEGKKEPASSWINKDLHPEAQERAPTMEVVKAPENKEEAPVQETVEPQKGPEEAKEVETQKEQEKAPEKVALPDYAPPKPVVKPWVPVEKTPEKVAEEKIAQEKAAPHEEKPPVDPIVAQAEKFTQEKQPAPPPPPASPKPPIAEPAIAAGGSVEVQLSALRSRAEAETVWQALSTRHRDVLGGKSHRIVTADIPGKGTYYRLRVGVASAAAAKSLCSTLTQRNQACILAR